MASTVLLVSDEFVRFLEVELKPFVDANYRTSGNRLDTAIFGASMAGVMAGAIFTSFRSWGMYVPELGDL